ncbi:MAG: hypothetical protein BWZ03_00809 [bacterium ADurb.BinA186]|nr:MAG: hypothetical protein BWZ03_00809 [bacterium ADurb.BinA186]
MLFIIFAIKELSRLIHKWNVYFCSSISHEFIFGRIGFIKWIEPFSAKINGVGENEFGIFSKRRGKKSIDFAFGLFGDRFIDDTSSKLRIRHKIKIHCFHAIGRFKGFLERGKHIKALGEPGCV